ncbi:MAG: hypothetical protein FJ010_10345 [Chloroflexi bacterium]|nr:hypothetical protein [Chloroflexota bacterium]
MINPSDFITLPYTPDMTQGGIAYACKSLPYTYNRMGTSPFNRLRRIVAGVAAELAFRRYLTGENIPHHNLGATPFTDPDRYDIAIGGRRCDIKSFLLIRKEQISQIRKEPSLLLDAQALVPEDQIASSNLGDEGLYLFAFCAALLTPNRQTLEKALQAGLPIYLIYPLPKEWARPRKWASLGTLALKSDTPREIEIELGGQNRQHRTLSEHIVLEPGRRTTARGDFYALHYLHTVEIPDGPVGVHSPTLEDTHIINSLDWGNIWIYGMEIIFTGYLTRGEFRRNARRLPAGSRVFQYPRTITPNFALPIRELHPIKELCDQAKRWAGVH